MEEYCEQLFKNRYKQIYDHNTQEELILIHEPVRDNDPEIVKKAKEIYQLKAAFGWVHRHAPDLSKSARSPTSLPFPHHTMAPTLEQRTECAGCIDRADDYRLKVITLICGKCGLHFCNDCWFECNDENCNWSKLNDHVCTTGHSGCDYCNY
jgi:hypothetical protein